MKENFVGYRASFVQKIFKNWSHGTFYNRVATLGIKDNERYMKKNDVSGSVLYNKEAIELLAEQYAKEYSHNITLEQLKEYIDKFLSSSSNASAIHNKQVVKEYKNEKNDNVDDVEKVDKKVEEVKEVNSVNDSDINEKYILRKDHDAIVKGLKEENLYLKDLLEKEKIEKESLTNIINAKEQKDIIIERQKLEIQLNGKENKDIKLIAEDEEHSRKGLFARLKEKFSKK